MLSDYGAELAKAANELELDDPLQAALGYHWLVATGHKKDRDTGANALRDRWAKAHVDRDLGRLRPADALWQPIARPEPDLTLLPEGSFAVRFTFTLAQPYLSKDDNPFYIIDNPIVRDPVFGLPLVRPSSWKGNLGAALRQLGCSEANAAWHRLLGRAPVGDDDANARAGRLTFYPTFFTKTGLEIINPHDRVTRVGQDPILMECVPRGAEGTFTLLYSPFGVSEAGKTGEARAQLIEDLPLLAEGLRALFRLYGFSAKRTSGYGLAEERVREGALALHLRRSQAAPTPAATALPTQPLPRYLIDSDHLHPRHLNPDGTFRERSEAELQNLKKTDRQEYERARAWWQRRQQQGVVAAKEAPSAPPPPAPEPPTLWEEPFDSFAALVEVARRIAGSLGEGGRP